ncbi:hypothetical protein TNCV_1116871 [Trichonephila clavipes]|nr:hypothetical protein TNCV_1116871 [Trichonephila clavipes]
MLPQSIDISTESLLRDLASVSTVHSHLVETDLYARRSVCTFHLTAVTFQIWSGIGILRRQDMMYVKFVSVQSHHIAVEVSRVGCQLKCHLRHLIVEQNYDGDIPPLEAHPSKHQRELEV